MPILWDYLVHYGIWYKASDDQFVHTMSNTSILDYQPLNSYTYVHLITPS